MAEAAEPPSFPLVKNLKATPHDPMPFSARASISLLITQADNAKLAAIEQVKFNAQQAYSRCHIYWKRKDSFRGWANLTPFGTEDSAGKLLDSGVK